MFSIRIADINVGIDNRYDGVRRLCRDYCIDSAATEFTASASDSEIAEEIKASERPVSPAYAESICIYRKICRIMPDYGAFLFHSAVVEFDGRAYAFSAPSGTGKTTHARLWVERFGSRARIINGDKPIIRFFGRDAYIYGTPWCGKEGYNLNVRSPLGAICFLERGSRNAIIPAQNHEITPRLLRQILVPRKAEEIKKMMPLLDLTVKNIPCWVLSCTISQKAAEVACGAMAIHGKGNNNDGDENQNGYSQLPD